MRRVIEIGMPISLTSSFLQYIEVDSDMVHSLTPGFFIRFADPDMFMRFKWGLGVGHTYSHHGGPSCSGSPPAPSEGSSFAEGTLDLETSTGSLTGTIPSFSMQATLGSDGNDDDKLELEDESDDPSLSLIDREPNDIVYDSDDPLSGEEGTEGSDWDSDDGIVDII
jgi:hypothetical protein